MSTFFSRSHIDQLQQYLVAMVAGRLEEPFSVTTCGNKTQGGEEIEPPIKTNEFKETDLDYNNDEEDKTEPESRNLVNTSDGLRSDHGNTGSRRADVENTEIVHKKPPQAKDKLIAVSSADCTNSCIFMNVAISFANCLIMLSIALF